MLTELFIAVSLFAAPAAGPAPATPDEFSDRAPTANDAAEADLAARGESRGNHAARNLASSGAARGIALCDES
ncbi:hypothetical protein [Nannocystis exedens]|uniref:hypothetical protein n=1 Tax=Nannocystis exedens TaxID=54 RepID=UPI00117E1146|nr:hypothetical protein [Nannocystis exedens]